MCSCPGNLVVLIVDDDPEVESFLRVILTLRGYETLAASDGAEALRVARNHDGRVDLLLTDVQMPGKMNGVQLAVRLISERPGIRVVLTSGLLSDQIACANLPFLPKPFTHVELYEIIDQVLEAAPPLPRAFHPKRPLGEHGLVRRSRNHEADAH